MKNIARKLSALLLVFVVSMAALCPAFAASASLPSLPSGQCVVDDANVLSSSTVQTITDLNAQLESSCSGAQIGVLTVDYTGSCTTEEYALQAANAWGIGSSTGNNGVLILLVMETQQYADGDYYIATGDGFRNTTLESQASALAQTMEDDFVRQDYDDAVTTCARNVAQTIADIYGVSLSDGNTNNGSYNEPAYDDNSSGGLGDILLGFITILFTVVLLLIIVSVVVYTFSGPLSGLFWCFGGLCQIAGADGVGLEGSVMVHLAAVHVGESGAVDDDVRALTADEVIHHLVVGDVQLRQVHRNDRGAHQLLGDGAKLTAAFPELLDDLGAKLASAAGNNDFHADTASLNTSVCRRPHS